MSPDMQARTLVEAAADQVPMGYAFKVVPCAEQLTTEQWDTLEALATGGRWREAVDEARRYVEAVNA